jgi:hypothetical protein
VAVRSASANAPAARVRNFMASSLALLGVTDFFGAVAVLCRLSPICLQRQDLLTISNVISSFEKISSIVTKYRRVAQNNPRAIGHGPVAQ